jgi:hypothetical protein
VRYGGNYKSIPSIAVQPGIAADRFAREIAWFLKVVGGALVAAECQTVGPLLVSRTSIGMVGFEQ